MFKTCTPSCPHVRKRTSTDLLNIDIETSTISVYVHMLYLSATNVAAKLAFTEFNSTLLSFLYIPKCLVYRPDETGLNRYTPHC